jgi:hypothetical protein
MHPKEKILALRAQRQLQIFNIQLKQKVKSHLMHDDIVFWKWISDTTLGIVTESAVYHWNGMTGTDAPVKVFDRHVSLAANQIINYRVNSEEKWLAVVGISSNQNPAGFKVKGAIQLYSVERGVSQPIEGHAACFAEIRLDGSSVDTKLFTFAVRTAQGAKVSLGLYCPLTLTLLCVGLEETEGDLFSFRSCTLPKSTTTLLLRFTRRRPWMCISRQKLLPTFLLPCKLPSATALFT